MDCGDDRNSRFVREALPHSAYLYRCAERLTGQRADAEDLLQETMLKGLSSYDSYCDGTNLRAWLRRIMTNAWVDRYRTAQRRPIEHLSHQIIESQTPRAHMPAVRSVEEDVLDRWPTEVSRAFSTLPESLRVPLYYADLEGRRYAEIAQIMQIPVGTVASRLHRARLRLRRSLLSRSHGPA
jgi:RNA polymerase sigma-70 factor, ECF subfamily